jgi:tRNA-binding EMAP/Myf-like protein
MTPAQVKSPVSPELLNQIDVRVGPILSVTDVANSDKLIALEVSFGDHRGTVLAGMKRERAPIQSAIALGPVTPTPQIRLASRIPQNPQKAGAR